MILAPFRSLLRAVALREAPEIPWHDGSNHYVLKTINGNTSLLCFKGRLYSGAVIFAAHNIPRHRMRLHMNPMGGHFVVSRRRLGPATIAVHVPKDAAKRIAHAYGARYTELDDYGRPVPTNLTA
ncbi:hypothetical protein RKE25_23245 (plasmid) [Dyella sp. BiH032]|uniref:hypothetical protein n=1 Tax=Dyella sp. BiH032 TaxID=3075430 RepID=UPI002892C8F0|nr:hypothetical protein [Dyella sp. BiH032]WNL48532.1 hypothetical protein RKE25_23245 [Dyella sp. BiH032]